MCIFHPNDSQIQQLKNRTLSNTYPFETNTNGRVGNEKAEF